MIKLKEGRASLGKRLNERSISEMLEYSGVVIDKPRGPSSHEVTSFVKKILNARRTGHAGTLDADVSGVLVVMLNSACKLSRFLSKSTKEYVSVMSIMPPASEKEIEEVFSHFRGKIYQTPPLESAVKKQLRIREVYKLNLLEVEKTRVLFSAKVEAGTYIRKLITDFGMLLDRDTKMLELRRISAAGFSLDNAITLQTLSDYKWLADNGKPEKLKSVLVNAEELIKLKKVVADDEAILSICKGANLAVPGIVSLDENIEVGEFVQILTGKGELVAIARALLSSGEIKNRKHGIALDTERIIHIFS